MCNVVFNVGCKRRCCGDVSVHSKWMLIFVSLLADDAQSYENVEAAIYTNQEKVTYYVSADQGMTSPCAHNLYFCFPVCLAVVAFRLHYT